jgi:hypothetical protein
MWRIDRAAKTSQPVMPALGAQQIGEVAEVPREDPPNIDGLMLDVRAGRCVNKVMAAARSAS